MTSSAMRKSRQVVSRELALSLACTAIAAMVAVGVLLYLLFAAVQYVSGDEAYQPAATAGAATAAGHANSTPAPIDALRRFSAAKAKAAAKRATTRAKKAVVHRAAAVLQPHPSTPYMMKRQKTHDALTSCVTPFGTRLGIADGVPAYSNCNTRFHSEINNYHNRRNPLANDTPIDPAGMHNYILSSTRYTALDYVMRWLLVQRGVAVPLVERVRDLWDSAYFSNLARANNQWQAVRIINGAAVHTRDDLVYTAPRRGDCIVFDNNGRFAGLEAGHIAVVVKVEDDVDALLPTNNNSSNKKKDTEEDNAAAAATAATRLRRLRQRRMQPRRVYVAEQNVHNTDWQGRNYSRVLTFHWESSGGVDVEDVQVDDKGNALAQPLYGVLVDPDGLFVVGRLRIGQLIEQGKLHAGYEDGLKERSPPEAYADA